VFSKNGIPLYYQLKEYIHKEIKESYKAGDKLPSEGEIERKYGVSRITVRKAIEELSREGVVVKKQGLGTFVQKQKVLYAANIIGSLTQRLEQQNYKLQTRSIEYIVIDDEHHVKDFLGCDTVLCIKRYRTLDGKPFASMLNYIDIEKVPNIEHEFNIESLYTFYSEHYGIKFYHAEETVEAKAATPEQARQLDIPVNAPLLSLQRSSYDKAHKPLEYSDIVIRADMYKHQIILLPH
jgi:DNA-binding GntR family transcriptional regulator